MVSKTHENGVVEVFDADAYQRTVDGCALMTCGTCGRTWDDGVPTSVTPVPSARCPFEYDHEDEPEACVCGGTGYHEDGGTCDECPARTYSRDELLGCLTGSGADAYEDLANLIGAEDDEIDAAREALR